MSARLVYQGTAPDGTVHLFRSRRARAQLKRHPAVKRLALGDLMTRGDRTKDWHRRNGADQRPTDTFVLHQGGEQ